MFNKSQLIRCLVDIFSRSSTQKEKISPSTFNPLTKTPEASNRQFVQTMPIAADLVLQDVHNGVSASLKEGVATHKEKCSYIEIAKENPKQVVINMICVDSSDRKKGVGTKLLNRVTAAADHHGVTLTLRPVPTTIAPGEITRQQLIVWYRKHGFKLGTDNEMSRPPQ